VLVLVVVVEEGEAAALLLQVRQEGRWRSASLKSVSTIAVISV
jgi:hypothetical protein